MAALALSLLALPAAVSANTGMPIAQADGTTATVPRHGTTLNRDSGARYPE